MRQNLKAYRKVNVESNILSADPHKVIVMMFDGLLESIVHIKSAITREDLDYKGKMVTKAVNILTALQNSLDKDNEPAVSENFDFLYAYCINRINQANINLDLALLDEVYGHLKPLRDAWSEMPEQGKQDGMQLIKERDAS